MCFNIQQNQHQYLTHRILGSNHSCLKFFNWFGTIMLWGLKIVWPLRLELLFPRYESSFFLLQVNIVPNLNENLNKFSLYSGRESAAEKQQNHIQQLHNYVTIYHTHNAWCLNTEINKLNRSRFSKNDAKISRKSSLRTSEKVDEKFSNILQ